MLEVACTVLFYLIECQSSSACQFRLKKKKKTSDPSSKFRATHSYTDFFFEHLKINLVAMTHSVSYRLGSWATHSAIMQFEGIDTDRNYESCPCRREGESSSSYTKNIQRSRASSSSTISKPIHSRSGKTMAFTNAYTYMPIASKKFQLFLYCNS